jgi:hypothetical protein
MVWPIIQGIPTDHAAVFVIADPRGKTKSGELHLSYNLTCVLVAATLKALWALRRMIFLRVTGDQGVCAP